MPVLNKFWNSEEYAVIEDIPMYTVPEHHLENVRSLDIRDSDILFYSHPKSGTHWLQNIISQLVDGGKIEEVDYISDYFATFHYYKSHANGVETFQNLPGPRRLGRAHYPITLVPQQTVTEGKGKVVYMARNPKDVMVSGYKFWVNFLNSFSGTFDDYFNMFVFQPEDLLFGHNLNHVQQWWKKRHEPNVSVLFYEDLKLDPFGEIKRLGEFLSCAKTDAEISEIVRKTDFEAQRSWFQNKTFYSHTPPLKEVNFFRKGTVGDWVHLFNVAQDRIFDEVYRRWTETVDESVPYKFEIDL